MSQWANENPERMAEIAALPLSQQTNALREAIGYDPDYIRDQFKTSPGLAASPSRARSEVAGPGVDLPACGACGAPAGVPCAKGCEGSRG